MSSNRSPRRKVPRCRAVCQETRYRLRPRRPSCPGRCTPPKTRSCPALPNRAPAPRPSSPLPRSLRRRTRRPRSRSSAPGPAELWVAVGFFAVVLLLLLIFILQNGAQVNVSYLGAHGHLPLGVALLLSAVCGVLLVVLAGAARISQLRGRGPPAPPRRHQARQGRRPDDRPPLAEGPRDAPRRLVQSAGGMRGVAQHDPAAPRDR